MLSCTMDTAKRIGDHMKRMEPSDQTTGSSQEKSSGHSLRKREREALAHMKEKRKETTQRLSSKLSHLQLPPADKMQQIQKRIRIVTAVLAIALVAFLVIGMRKKWFNSPRPLTDLFVVLGVPGYILSGLLVILNTIFPVIPGSLPALAMFMAYGNLWGFLSVMCMSLIGSILSFQLSRKYGATFVLSFVPKDLFEKIMAKIVDEKAATKLAIIAFLVPGIPDDATVMILGLTKMRFSRFVALCLLTKPIPTFLFLFGFSSLIDLFFNFIKTL